jgi:hypothetical protein
MCPNECPGLYDVYGDEFEAFILLTKKKEKEEKPSKHVNLGENSRITNRNRNAIYACIKMQQTENQIKKI